uniref:Uncharacterized protein n=1 Tax=viral metagenome TaxID=1070528 RepID=A0A6M3M8R9_9ZZZZ
MKKIFILFAAILILSVNAAAQENNSKKISVTITVDTGGNTGHLVYKELYYKNDGSGNLTFDTGRTYFNGTINSSKIKIHILRPLDSSGKPYPDSRIRAMATLDNKTIINGWYKTNKQKNSTDNDPAETKKTPGFEAMAALGLISLMYLIRRK